MQAFLVSTAVVALAEVGDKTQLLAFVLATRYRRPWPIVAGILTATVVNHALAGLVGRFLGASLDPRWLRYSLIASFLAMALWILKPDSLDEDEGATASRFGVFGTTVISFFLAEMGDKTQIATVALAARYPSVLAVVAGTTCGMLLANAPAVWMGDRLAGRLPVQWIHRLAAAVFVVLGLVLLLQ